MKRFVMVALFGLLLWPFGGEVSSQGADVCAGRVSGTVFSENPNLGTTYFDAHPGPNGVADLSLVGESPGFAPGDVRYAACTQTDLNGRVSVGEFVNEDYFFELRGYAWNSNLGFISFACEDGVNRSAASVGAGANCGAFDYGVYLAPPEVGLSELFGYAYNGVFGWIQFGGDCVYGPATANARGEVTGYACTESGVPLPLDGMTVEYLSPFAGDAFLDEIFGGFLDGEGEIADDELRAFLADSDEDADLEEIDSEWCEGQSGLCVEVYPNPFGLRSDVEVDSERALKLADGEESYEVRIYLRDEDLNGLNDGDFENYEEFLDSIELVWEDTVKLDQTRGEVGDSLADLRSPFDEEEGGVLFKPLSFEDFESRGGGLYVAEVKSLAPTTKGNVSLTHTDPPFAVANEQFIYAVDADLPEEDNVLKLKRIEHDELILVGGEEFLPQQPEFANGRVDLAFEFRPAVEVDELFANAYEDAITAIRNIPVNLRFGLAAYGDLPQRSVDEAVVDVYLDLDQEAQDGQFDECNGTDFDFYFLNSFDPGEAERELVERDSLSSSYAAYMADHPEGEWDLKAKASLREGNEACAILKAPSLYTVVSLNVFGQEVKYYSNKLPKIDAAIKNPTVVVHGNIQARSVTSVSADRPVSSFGSVNTATSKSVSKENTNRYFDVPERLVRREVCELTSLAERAAFDDDCEAQYLEIEGERAFYFSGQDVALELEREDFVDGDKVVLIVDGGNIFIDSDLYNPEVENYLTLVTFRDRERFEETGHVYISGRSERRDAVKNVRATIIADGSLFSYSGDVRDIDEDSGEPIFESLAERLEALSDQLLIEGSVYSDNTIGGGDIDSVGGKDYLLLGGGRVIFSPFNLEDRLRAQAYDLNYLRLFQLELELAENGLPVDQNCGRALDFEAIRAIRDGAILCGDRGECDAVNGGANVCNGINPYERYVGIVGEENDGDLIIPRDLSRLSLGLDNGLSLAAGGRPADPDAPRWLQKKDYEPVFVFFREGYGDSFIFEVR